MSVSADGAQRNITLGQNTSRYDTRLRATSTTANGTPSVTSDFGTLSPALTHVVYTRAANGDATVWINGEVNTTASVDGTLDPWDPTYPLTLANETTGNRPWLGTYSLVAIYDQALDASQVQQNFSAGAELDGTPPIVDAAQSFLVPLIAQDGDPIGTVATTDTNPVVEFAIAAGNTNAAFAIDNSGVLTVNDSSQIVAGATFALTIQAADASFNVGSGTVDIIVVADTTPPIVDPGQTFVVADAAPDGEVIGTVTASDDVAVTSLTITGGDPGGAFALSPTGVLSVADTNQLVGPATATLTIQATDSSGNTASETVAVDISDIALRITSGLLALYEFNEGTGAAVTDTSGVGTPLDLTIQGPANTTWTPGALTINSSTTLLSNAPATKISDAVTASNEITIEAWVASASATQSGPARIVSISTSSSSRNATLGQLGDTYDVRVRTTDTSANGRPSTSTPAGALDTSLSHVVYTRAANGDTTIWVDGVAVETDNVGGTLASWQNSYSLLLGNETSGTRPWLGTFELVAFYDRALSAAEVATNLAAGNIGAGPDTTAPVIPAGQALSISQAASDGATVGTVAATDDFGVTSFSILSGDPTTAFAIDSSGLLTVVDSNQLVAGSVFSLLIGAQDAAGNGTNRLITVDITAPGTRVTTGLLALYEFEENGGAVVNDTSGQGTPLNLTIDAPANTAWSPGMLTLNSPTTLTSGVAATKISDAAMISGEISIEAWITPSNTFQTGPARIASLSESGSVRNVTMGQLGSQYDVRLRTTATTANGQPSTTSAVGTATTNQTHVVFTRNVAGTTTIWIDGVLTEIDTVAGTLGSWDNTQPFLLGNETTGTRPWLGSYELVAVYDRALTATDVTANFAAGANPAGGGGGGDVTAPIIDPGQAFTTSSLASNGDVVGAVSASDETGVTGFAITAGDPGAVFAIDNAGTITVADASQLAVGSTTTLTVTANDAAGNSATAPVDISVVVQRSTNGLLALYEFNENAGAAVTDTSGVGTPLNLTIQNPANTTWTPGQLTLDAATSIVSDTAATKISDAVLASGQFSLEAWVTPVDNLQSGAAKVATLAGSATTRNVGFGQQFSNWIARVRTTTKTDNGTAGFSAPSNAGPTLVHLVLSFDGAGNSQFWIDGAMIRNVASGGDLSNWDNTFDVVLGSDPGGVRPWLGSYDLVAFYDRQLSPAEVNANFTAGN